MPEESHGREPDATSAIDFDRARRLVEHGMGIANLVLGATLTIGGLGLGVYWRLRFGGFGALRGFYLCAAWAFGTLQLIAAIAMLRRWALRWVLQMLPLIVPILAYQYFVLHFIFRQI